MHCLCRARPLGPNAAESARNSRALVYHAGTGRALSLTGHTSTERTRLNSPRSAALGYRIFTDSRGIEWQTWDVVPRLEERRVSERRLRAILPPETDRRARVDRRILVGHRSVLNSGLNGGWLCFEAQLEKRRLSPIPGDWERCPRQRLEQYCAHATPARRVATDIRNDHPGN